MWNGSNCKNAIKILCFEFVFSLLFVVFFFNFVCIFFSVFLVLFLFMAVLFAIEFFAFIVVCRHLTKFFWCSLKLNTLFVALTQRQEMQPSQKQKKRNSLTSTYPLFQQSCYYFHSSIERAVSTLCSFECKTIVNVYPSSTWLHKQYLLFLVLQNEKYRTIERNCKRMRIQANTDKKIIYFALKSWTGAAFAKIGNMKEII